MIDMLPAVAPKSDQLNADDLIAGSITIRITNVVVSLGQEQPIRIRFEGDNGKPYKPCKSMARVMVELWGRDATLYAGRRMTLFRDPSVSYGAEITGGIRISHMSHIPGKVTLAVTVSKKRRKTMIVQPLSENAAPPRRTAAQFLEELEREIAAARGRTDARDVIDTILARPEVKKAEDVLQGASLERLKTIMKEAWNDVCPPDRAEDQDTSGGFA